MISSRKIRQTWAEINRRWAIAKEARKVNERVEQEVSQHLIEQQKASEVPGARWLEGKIGENRYEELIWVEIDAWTEHLVFFGLIWFWRIPLEDLFQ